MVIAIHKNPSDNLRETPDGIFFILRDFSLFRKYVILIIIINIIHAALIRTEERARALPEADQGNMASRTQADAGGRVQLAESEISLRSTTARMGEGKRSGPKSRSGGGGERSRSGSGGKRRRSCLQRHLWLIQQRE